MAYYVWQPIWQFVSIQTFFIEIGPAVSENNASKYILATYKLFIFIILEGIDRLH